MEKIKQILSTEERCDVCHKRKAEYLCDMPINRSHPLHLRVGGKTDYQNSFKWITNTCDKKICKECAVDMSGDIHFCKDCIKRIKIRMGGKQ